MLPMSNKNSGIKNRRCKFFGMTKFLYILYCDVFERSLANLRVNLVFAFIGNDTCLAVRKAGMYCVGTLPLVAACFGGRDK